MKKVLLFFCLIIIAFTAHSQKCTVDKLIDMVNWPGKRIDTTLTKMGYVLMKKDVDSASSLYQYSYLDVREKKPTTLRSLAYMDAQAHGFKSRLLTYRTYSKEEYQEIITYLLNHDYRSTGQYDFGASQHTVYSNGEQSIRVKVTTVTLDKHQTYITYELELGK